MTNREKILSLIGDTIIVNNLIECVHAYRIKDELRAHNPHIEYKFNGNIYKTYEDAFNAVKKWLDEEVQNGEDNN